VVAGIAAGASIFILLDFRQHSLGEIPHNLAEVAIMIPFIWIFILALFVLVTNFSFKHTSHGYRYKFGWLFLLVCSAVLILGSVLELVGIGENHSPVVQTSSFVWLGNLWSQDAWDQPSAGRLGGTVISVQNNHEFFCTGLQRPDSGTWGWPPSTSFLPLASSTIFISGLYDSPPPFLLPVVSMNGVIGGLKDMSIRGVSISVGRIINQIINLQ